MKNQRIDHATRSIANTLRGWAMAGLVPNDLIIPILRHRGVPAEAAVRLLARPASSAIEPEVTQPRRAPGKGPSIMEMMR